MNPQYRVFLLCSTLHNYRYYVLDLKKMKYLLVLASNLLIHLTMLAFLPSTCAVR